MYVAHASGGLPIGNYWKTVSLRVATCNLNTCHVARVDLVTRRDTDTGLVCELINLTMHAMQPAMQIELVTMAAAALLRFICWVMDGSW